MGVRRAAPTTALGIAVIIAAIAGAAAFAAAQTSGRIDPRQALARSEAVLGQPVGDHKLVATNGEVISLASFRGQPLIVSLVYSSCGSLCPATTQHLIDAVERARRAVGADRFQVLTVGFDARNDTPARMAQFAALQHIKFSNWRVASGDGPTIQALLSDLGFTYAEIAGGFDHVTQTTLVGPDGKVFRQIYGEDFPVRMLVEPLKDAVYGTRISVSLKSVIDRLKFLCTAYDPGAGRYRIDYGLIFGSVLAALSLVVMGGLILREWLRTQRARPDSPRFQTPRVRSRTARNA
jgi:protein SCO1